MSRAESTRVRERRGVGNTKNSVPIPRGVHEARQKHAPCVGKAQKLRSNTTYVTLDGHARENKNINFTFLNTLFVFLCFEQNSAQKMFWKLR